MYELQRSDDDIDYMLETCDDIVKTSDLHSESRFPGLAYEEGIRDAIIWLTNKYADSLLSSL